MGLAVLRDPGLQDDGPRVNPNGGDNGGRRATTAVNQLRASGGRYAMCTMCIGVGQGIAVVVGRV